MLSEFSVESVRCVLGVSKHVSMICGEAIALPIPFPKSAFSSVSCIDVLCGEKSSNREVHGFGIAGSTVLKNETELYLI